MRRSEVLTRLAGKSPCLLCHLPVAELSTHGRGDAAFLLPDLARAVWGAAGITEGERDALNEMLSALLRCSVVATDDRARLLADLKPRILQLAEQSDELRDICTEFLTSFDDV